MYPQDKLVLPSLLQEINAAQRWPILGEDNYHLSGEWREDPLTAKLSKMESDIREALHFQKTFVTQQEFKPVKAIVYGMVGVILTAVIISIISLVVSGKHQVP